MSGLFVMNTFRHPADFSSIRVSNNLIQTGKLFSSKTCRDSSIFQTEVTELQSINREIIAPEGRKLDSKMHIFWGRVDVTCAFWGKYRSYAGVVGVVAGQSGGPTSPGLSQQQESPIAAASNVGCASGSGTPDSRHSLSHFGIESVWCSVGCLVSPGP